MIFKFNGYEWMRMGWNLIKLHKVWEDDGRV